MMLLDVRVYDKLVIERPVVVMKIMEFVEGAVL